MKSNDRKYTYIYVFAFLILIAIVLFFIFKNKNSQNNNNQQNNDGNNVARLASELNDPNMNNRLNEVNTKVENVLSNSTNENKATEEEIASYSTDLSGSTENRLTNIRITCKKLDGKIIENGESFSFCENVGPSTAEEGYKEATVIMDGEKVQGLGGGNCQVSSTLYNAVLSVSDLKVLERHEHGRTVGYVPKGKDAAVSYGSVDFRFQNNTGNRIKMYFNTDDVTLSVRIVKL